MSKGFATPARRDVFVAAAITGCFATQSVAFTAERRTAFPSLKA
jgi:hypothetical protein